MRLLTAIILFLMLFLVVYLVEKYLGIKRKLISETPAKRIDRWGRTIILGIFLSSSFFAITNEVEVILKWNWVLFFTALMGLQTILEWKYIKESKQYISTLISSMLLFIFLVFFVNLF